MNIGTRQRLDATLSAVCPILGTSGDQGSVRIDYDPSATAPQQAAAQSALASFGWSQGAQDTFDQQQLTKTIGRANAVRLTADVSNSTVNFADCTGLSFPVGIGSFGFRFVGAYTAAAGTTGLQLAMNGPAMSFLAAAFTVYESATAPRVAVAAAYDNGVNGINSGGSTALPFCIDGNITTTAAGVLVVRFRSEVAASAVTIKRGSMGELKAVA